MNRVALIAALVGVSLASPLAAAAQTPKPNIVLVFMDNFGWGELGVYRGGILRGAPTPRIDALASEGMRLLNFNVEAQAPNVPENLWGRFPAGKILTDHAVSLQKEPPIRPGTPDPYAPKH